MSLFDKYNINPHALDVTYGDDYFFLAEYLGAAFIYPPLKLSDSVTRDAHLDSTLDDTTAEFEAYHIGNKIESTLEDTIAEFRSPGNISGDIYASLGNASADFLGSFATLDKRGKIIPSAIFVTVYDYPNLNYTDSIKNVGEDYSTEEVFEYYLASNIKFDKKISEQIIDTIPSVDKYGSWIPYYKEDLYNKILIIPPYFNIGNLLSTITRKTEIWNTYIDEARIAENLEQIDTEGIYIIEGESSTPFSIPGFHSEVYEFEITMEGPPSIDAEYRWYFDSDEMVALNIVGSRVVIFPIPPDSDVEEIIRWLTDVIETYDGTEKRQCLRTVPRHTLNYEITLDDEKEQRFTKTLLAGWHTRTFALPYWHEARIKKESLNVGNTAISIDTKYAQYVEGGMAYIHETPFKNEAVEISAIEEDAIILSKEVKNDYNPGTFIMPIKGAWLSAKYQHTDKKQRTTYDMEWRISEREDSEIEGKELCPKYKNKEVFIYPNLIEGEGINREVDLETTFIDYKTGVTTRVDKFDYPKTHTDELIFEINSRRDMWEFREWMYHLRGKNRSFWLPTFKNDMVMNGKVSPTQRTILFNWMGYARYLLKDSQNHKYIAIFTKHFGSGVNYRGDYDSDTTYYSGDAVSVDDPATDDLSIHVALEITNDNYPISSGKTTSKWGPAIYFREIVDSSEEGADDDTEYIELNEGLTMELDEYDSGYIKMISYLNLMRLNTDRIEILWNRVDKTRIVLPLLNLFNKEEV